MSENEIKFISYEEAIKIVAAIQEEEDIEQQNRRILTVYNKDDKEICWFDYEQVLEEIASDGKKPEKEVVQNYILHRIPDWALEI